MDGYYIAGFTSHCVRGICSSGMNMGLIRLRDYAARVKRNLLQRRVSWPRFLSLGEMFTGCWVFTMLFKTPKFPLAFLLNLKENNSSTVFFSFFFFFFLLPQQQGISTMSVTVIQEDETRPMNREPSRLLQVGKRQSSHPKKWR